MEGIKKKRNLSTIEMIGAQRRPKVKVIETAGKK